MATRKHAHAVYGELQRAVPVSGGVEILMYHAALAEVQRTKVRRSFVTAEHPVVIVTTAFGMGIDRADIRFVVRWDIPGGVEQYSEVYVNIRICQSRLASALRSKILTLLFFQQTREAE